MTRLSEHLQDLVGKQVKLARGGPDEAKGVLLGAKDDYLILFSNEGTLIHYPIHHLKSVTELMDAGDFVQQIPLGLLESLPKNFCELMRALRGRKIKIYDHGPESAQGFLFDCGEDFIKLVVTPDEVIHYPMFHIRSVAVAKQKSQNNEKKDSKNNNSNNINKDEQNKNEQASLDDITRQIAWVRGRDERLYYANFDGDVELEKEKEKEKESRRKANKG